MHTIIHAKQSIIPDSSNADLVRASDWNADHAISWSFATPNKTTITSADGDDLGDALFGKVALLIQADAVNGSSAFTDMSGRGLALTATGTAFHSNTASKWSTTSAYFNGNTSYVSGTLTDVIAASDFCIESWIRLSSTPLDSYLIDMRTAENTGTCIYFDASRNMVVKSDGIVTTISYPLPADEWVHVCVERAAGVTRMFVDGINIMNTRIASMPQTAFRMGYAFSGSVSHRAFYLQDFRITVGSARYTSTTSSAGTLVSASAADNDAYYHNVVALARMNGMAQGTKIQDETGRTATLTGATAHTSTTASMFGGSSLKISDVADYASITGSTEFNMSSLDFTVEFWVNFSSAGATAYVGTRASVSTGWAIQIEPAGVVRVYTAGDSYVGTNWTPAINTWYHVAACKASGVVKIFVDGSQVGGDLAVGSVTDSSASLKMACTDGFMQDVRVTRGTCRYTGVFARPTKPHANRSSGVWRDPHYNSVSCLLKMDRRYSVDAFANSTVINMRADTLTDDVGSTITTSGSPVVVADTGPFVASNSISIPAASSVNIANGFNIMGETGDFTIELWFKVTAFGSTATTLFDSRAGGLNNGILGTCTATGIGYEFRYNGGSYTPGPNYTGTIQPNVWYHLALTKNSTTYTTWLNGVSVATLVGPNYSFSNGSVKLGYTIDNNASYAFAGYMDDFRVSTECRYTQTFTPAAIPASMPRNVDAKSHVVKHYGNVTQNVTSQKMNQACTRFNGGWLALDGSSDFALGAGDFTVEFWMNSQAFISQASIMDFRPTSVATGHYPTFYFSSTTQLCWYSNGGALLTVTHGMVTGTWYHVAVCRASGTLRILINGEVKGSVASSVDHLNATGRPYIGGASYTDGTGPINAHIQELRITKGVARYPAAFAVNQLPAPVMLMDATQDPWFRGVSLHARLNNTLDASLYAHTLSLGGGAVIDSSSLSRFGASCLNTYAGGGWLSVSDASRWNFGADDFTVELWVKTIHDQAQAILGTRVGASTGWSLRMTAAGLLEFYAVGNTLVATAATAINTGNWVNVVVTRKHGQIRLFVNGVLEITVTCTSACTGSLLLLARIEPEVTTLDYHGWLCDVRITNQVARYTATFSPLNSPFTTSMSHDETFMLKSSPACAYWAGGDVSGSVVAGSGVAGAIVGTEFTRNQAGPSDYSVWRKSTRLTNKLSDTRIALGDAISYPVFTMQCVFKLDAITGTQHVMSKNEFTPSSVNSAPFVTKINADASITVELGKGDDMLPDVTLTGATGMIQANTWYHLVVAVTPVSVKVWLNGEVVIQGTINMTTTTNSLPWTVGGPAAVSTAGAGAASCTGNFCGMSIVNGVLSDHDVLDQYVLSGVNARTSANYTSSVGLREYVAPINKSAARLPGFAFAEGMSYTSAGPIEINGVDVTVPKNTSWVIL